MGPDEWRRLRAVRLRALSGAPGAFASRLEHEQARAAGEWRRWATPTAARTTFAAVEGPRWVGIATGVLDERGDVADLVGMWVDPDRRRRGAGRSLALAVVGWAATAGAAEVRLWVVGENAPARLCYERAGFRATGRVQPLPRDAAVLEVEMRRAVEPPTARVRSHRPDPRSAPDPALAD